METRQFECRGPAAAGSCCVQPNPHVSLCQLICACPICCFSKQQQVLPPAETRLQLAPTQAPAQKADIGWLGAGLRFVTAWVANEGSAMRTRGMPHAHKAAEHSVSSAPKGAEPQQLSACPLQLPPCSHRYVPSAQATHAAWIWRSSGRLAWKSMARYSARGIQRTPTSSSSCMLSS